jgi:membrane-associated phospholipid phosphatase
VSRTVRAIGAGLAACLIAGAASAGSPSAPDSTRGFRLDRWDAVFGLASATVVAVAAAHDREITRQVIASDSRSARRLARWAQPLGSPFLLAPGVALVWSAAHLAHAPALLAASVRGGITIGGTGIAVTALKELIGRARPKESPDDAGDFDPFSTQESFPSGHSALAVAAATVLDRETGSPWVPRVAYPIAVLVGWSRVQEREHWASDVLAGAALGYWTASKAEDVLRARSNGGLASSLSVEPAPGGARAAMSVRF